MYSVGKFEPRLMLPLSLSYDHRMIDGADAARFLRWLCEAFEQPFLLSLQGSMMPGRATWQSRQLSLLSHQHGFSR